MGMDRRRYQLIPATKIRSKPLSQEAAEALAMVDVQTGQLHLAFGAVLTLTVLADALLV